MDEFEQSDLENESNDYHNIFYQNAIHCKERENAFIKKHNTCGIFSLVFVKELGGRMTEIFSVGPQLGDR